MASDQSHYNSIMSLSLSFFLASGHKTKMIILCTRNIIVVRNKERTVLRNSLPVSRMMMSGIANQVSGEVTLCELCNVVL